MSFTAWHSEPIQKAAADKIAEVAFTSSWSESIEFVGISLSSAGIKGAVQAS